jgi:hypothetical protein
MILHRQLAVDLIRRFGKPAAEAMRSLGTRNARRLAIMAGTGELSRAGRAQEVLAVIAQYGDRAMDFIWRHKGSLTIATVLTVFLAKPEAFLSGSRDLAEAVTQEVARPLAEVPGEVAAGITANTNWTAVILAGIALATLAVAPFVVRRCRQSR